MLKCYCVVVCKAPVCSVLENNKSKCPPCCHELDNKGSFSFPCFVCLVFLLLLCSFFFFKNKHIFDTASNSQFMFFFTSTMFFFTSSSKTCTNFSSSPEIFCICYLIFSFGFITFITLHTEKCT